MMTDPHSQSAQPSPPAPAASIGLGEEVEINLVRLVSRVIRGYKVILAFTFAGALISAAIAMALHKTYTADAMFLPPLTPETAQASSIFSRQNPSDLYLGMLGSRTVADFVIEQVNLKSVYHQRFSSDAAATLARQTKFGVSKNNLINISVQTGDPKLSMDIANAYLDALYKLNGSMSASASVHRREFLQAQIDHERDALAQAEYDMQAVQEKTGVILPEGEAAAGLTATARLQGALEESQTRLSAMLLSETEENPQVKQLRREIETLQGQISRQQIGTRGAPGTGLPSGARLPGLMIDSLRKTRELKEKEAVYESLMQQYEKARVASDDPGPQLQIVDRAVLPEHKSGPPRTSIVIVGTLLAGVVGLLWVLLADPVRTSARRYAMISSSLPAR